MRADGRTGGGTDGHTVRQSDDPLVRRSPEWEFRGGLWVQVQQRLRACLSDFRRIVGMPDYQEYVRHLRLVHPSWPVPSERQFFELYMQTRYGDGPTRCC